MNLSQKSANLEFSENCSDTIDRIEISTKKLCLYHHNIFICEATYND